MNCYNTIESLYPTLTKTEKIIADYILKEKSKVMYLSLSELANAICVGDASIVRFCRKIGYEGFQNLKLSIAQHGDIDETSGETYVEKIQMNFQKVVSSTKDMLSLSELNKAILAIKEAKRIVAFGVGSSAEAAKELEIRFLRIGVLIKTVSDPHFQNMTASILNKDDVVIAFSLSGRTKDTVDAVSFAKQAGAKIISITNFPLSPLAAISDYVLLTAKKESYIEGGSLVAKISQLYVTDLLCTGYSLLDIEKTKEMKTKTASSILHKSME